MLSAAAATTMGSLFAAYASSAAEDGSLTLASVCERVRVHVSTFNFDEQKYYES